MPAHGEERQGCARRNSPGNKRTGFIQEGVLQATGRSYRNVKEARNVLAMQAHTKSRNIRRVFLQTSSREEQHLLPGVALCAKSEEIRGRIAKGSSEIEVIIVR